MLLALRNLLLILPLLLGPWIAAPAERTNIQENRASLDFPDSIAFSLRADDPNGIARVTLIYGTDANLCLAGDTRHPMQIQTGNRVDAEWTWDLNHAAYLPPGVIVHWQWEIVDGSGATLLTEPKTLEISDPNYTWRSLANSSLKVTYAEGGSSFGQMALGIAASSLTRITQQTGVAAPEKIQIVIYPSAADLRDATLHMPDWIGGVAFPEFNIVLMAIPPGETDWAGAVIPHELTHLVVHRRISNCQGATLPTWLDEGLAVSSEGSVSSVDTGPVMEALKKEKAPDLLKLAEGFSANAALANEEYAQSGMVTRWLLKTYGPKKMEELLGAVQSGSRIDEALLQAYGQTTDGLDQTWRVSLGFAARPTEPAEQETGVRTPVPTLALDSPLGLAATATSMPQSGLNAAPTTPSPSTPRADTQSTRSSAVEIGLLMIGGGTAVFLLALGAFLMTKSNPGE